MTSPATLLNAWNLLARKELGQNFIKEPALAGRIADLGELNGQEVVLDVGAGLGAMTIAAARRVKKVIAVEKDDRMIPLLRTEILLQGCDNVEIVHHDILTLDLAALSSAEGRRLTVIGNLPYNISSPVLIKLIHTRHCIDRAILMFQKELADRLCADPGSRTYGRISVMLQYCATVKILRQVRAEMFFPKPKVDSMVLAVEFHKNLAHPVSDENLMEQVVQAAFGQRRKTLRNALSSGWVGLDVPDVERVLSAADIDPRRRAETLSVAEFVRLTEEVVHLRRGHQNKLRA